MAKRCFLSVFVLTFNIIICCVFFFGGLFGIHSVVLVMSGQQYSLLKEYWFFYIFYCALEHCLLLLLHLCLIHITLCTGIECIFGSHVSIFIYSYLLLLLFLWMFACCCYLYILFFIPSNL